MTAYLKLWVREGHRPWLCIYGTGLPLQFAVVMALQSKEMPHMKNSLVNSIRKCIEVLSSIVLSGILVGALIFMGLMILYGDLVLLRPLLLLIPMGCAVILWVLTRSAAISGEGIVFKSIYGKRIINWQLIRRISLHDKGRLVRVWLHDSKIEFRGKEYRNRFLIPEIVKRIASGVIEVSLDADSEDCLVGYVLCQSCGYDLRGSETGECPECGSEFDLASINFLSKRLDTAKPNNLDA